MSSTIAVITGVSREQGIGFGIAKSLLKLGFQTIITARRRWEAEELAEKISNDTGLVIGEHLDITDDTSVQQLAAYIRARYGKLNVLINNAGGVFDHGVQPTQTDFNTMRQALEVNLFGTWSVIKYLLPLLKEGEHPRIVNVSSGAASFSHPEFGLAVHPAIMTSYSISKLALNGLTVKLARELKSDKILINAVNPGFVATAAGMEKMGARSVEASVPGIIWAATLPDDGPTGKFFEDQKEVPW